MGGGGRGEMNADDAEGCRPQKRDDSDADPGHLKPTGVLPGCREDGGAVSECTRGMGVSWSHCWTHPLSVSSSFSQAL